MIINLFEQMKVCKFIFKKEDVTIDDYDKLFKECKKFFRDSLIFMEVTGVKGYLRNLNLLKEMINAVRVVIDYVIIKRGALIEKFNSMVFTLIRLEEKSEFNKNIYELLSSKNLAEAFNEILMLYVLLLNPSELTYLNILFYHIFPYLILRQVIFSLYRDFDFDVNGKSLKENLIEIKQLSEAVENEKENLKEPLLPYLRKRQVNLRGQTDESLIDKILNMRNFDITTEYSYFCGFLNIPDEIEKIVKIGSMEGYDYPSFWKNPIGYTELEDNFQFLLYEYSLEVAKIKDFNEYNLLVDLKTTPQLEFINLPSDVLALSVYYAKIDCKKCEKENKNNGVVCLLCGLKVCYGEKCCMIYMNNKSYLETVSHSKLIIILFFYIVDYIIGK